MKTLNSGGLRAAFFVKLLLALTLLGSTALAQPVMEGANSGGGGGLRRTQRPDKEAVIEYVKGWAAVYLSGYLYSIGGDRYMKIADRLAKGVTIELRTDSPCMNDKNKPAVSSIYARKADICLNPQMFLDQTTIWLTQHNFSIHLGGLLLHEVTHLIQHAEHGKITKADEREALSYQDDYINAGESGLLPKSGDLASLYQMSFEVPKVKNLHAEATSASDRQALCASAHNLHMTADLFLLYAVGVVVNNVHMVGLDSDYWGRDSFYWRAAFRNAEELEPITQTPRGKEYERQPSFIKVAEKFKRYHCTENSDDFENFADQKYSSKEEMYNAYRDLYLSQMNLLAEKSKAVIAVRFKIGHQKSR